MNNNNACIKLHSMSRGGTFTVGGGWWAFHAAPLMLFLSSSFMVWLNSSKHLR